MYIQSADWASKPDWSSLSSVRFRPVLQQSGSHRPLYREQSTMPPYRIPQLGTFDSISGVDGRKRGRAEEDEGFDYKRRRRYSLSSEPDDSFSLTAPERVIPGPIPTTATDTTFVPEPPAPEQASQSSAPPPPRPQLSYGFPTTVFAKRLSGLAPPPELMHRAMPPPLPKPTVRGHPNLARSETIGCLREVDALTKITYPETSAHRHMRPGKQTIDFSVANADATNGVWPVSWSLHDLVVFTRGKRVHYKNLAASEGVGQLCKVSANHGNVRLLQCGGREQPNVVALCTAKGHIQLWDISAKKLTASWTVKGATAMQWNGPTLTVGGERGSIRHFDTRIKETAKMKEQTKKVTRHQARISSVAWNGDGKLMASGDASGLVLVWDARQNTPLDVGEMVQRRRKMQHVGVVHALAWCPWQTKMLASGDSAPDGSGTIRLWNVQESSMSRSKSNYPDRLQLDAQVTSLHFSAHCKELLSTHGPGKSTPWTNTHAHMLALDGLSSGPTDDVVRSKIANSVLVHSYPFMRRVSTIAAAEKNIAGSVLSPNGLRIVLAVPEEMKLKFWDVWGREKETMRRHSSLLNFGVIR
ncbi:Cell division cycle protein 20 [Grifola frondosa]|uniref:Cell division cycle protein 20 n=1 Tax=Grifola frondosa TaxID=5627 RepID=A0A1C7MCG1_GRIFR|nr:Cell division cycle protein 20 [Grifola frondosa]